MSNLTVENVYTRHTAKGLARKYFWKLLGMMVLSMIIIYAFIYAISFGGSFLLSMLTGTSMNSTQYGAAPSSLYIVGSLVLMLATTLVGGGLGLGMTAAMLDLCRGDETVTVGRIFSRMGQCLKAFGLNLWVGLKTFLWMLPGFVIMVIAVELAADSDNAGLISILPLLAMIAMMALVIPAAYRYMLSTYILADQPETGVFDCVNKSKALMAGHKWQAFKLIIPIVLVLYAVVLGTSLLLGLLAGMLGESAVAVVVAIVAVIAIVFFALPFGMRMSLAYCLFYLNRIGEGTPADEAAQAE